MQIISVNSDSIGYVDACVAEFQVYMPELLRCGKVKIKIYKSYKEKSLFYGFANIMVITKFDNTPDGECGIGETIEDSLICTINNLVRLIKADYQEGLELENMVYDEYSDF